MTLLVNNVSNFKNISEFARGGGSKTLAENLATYADCSYDKWIFNALHQYYGEPIQ